MAVLVGPKHARAANFGAEGFTGHQNGLMGHRASTGMRPSHPTAARTLRPYSVGCGWNVHAVSVPASLDTPSRLSTSCDSSFRVIMSERRQLRAHIFSSMGFMKP